MQKAALPKGTRDFSPTMMFRRNLIINTIKKVYEKYGFDPIETPAMENLTTLTGKYGEEGDKLLFKILNSGDFLASADVEVLANKNSQKLTWVIAEKGLRYDLTVPFARYVVQNQSDITFPFKRYQIQPVWRADRPQKGRYREFWQCDADVIGTKSLLCEADFLKIYEEVFQTLGLKDYEVRINHRKLLEAVTVSIGFTGSFTEFTVAIDKLDKIGWDGVGKELSEKGVDAAKVELLKNMLLQLPLTENTLETIKNQLVDCQEKEIALHELGQLIGLAESHLSQVVLDLSLARGLDYYTGCIFEAVIKNSGIGSVSGGGRYDNLTEIFGLKDVSGVGISFGIDRIYDVMDALQLFQNQIDNQKIIFCHFDEKAMIFCSRWADELRKEGIKVVVYPDQKKIGKQFDYANKLGFDLVAVVGDNEMAENCVQLKNMTDGSQSKISLNELIIKLKK
ncbi:MAG: histidine--tRNA ligase [Flavobacteriales bacterium]|nr:histidine--tRNA ligase [Flavobacteriales bacterium]